MKKLMICLALLGLLLLTASTHAQDKQANPEAAKKAKIIPVKVQVVLSEYDGERKISSMPYTMVIGANYEEYPHPTASLRLGVRIPVSKISKEHEIEYIDVGSNLDCGVSFKDDGPFLVNLRIDRSSLYATGSAKDGERAPDDAHQDPDHPLLRQMRASQIFVLRENQTTEAIMATDPLNGHVLRVSVTLSIAK